MKMVGSLRVLRTVNICCIFKVLLHSMCPSSCTYLKTSKKLIYLLRFIEPMNLINKEDGFPFEKALFILGLLYDISHIICLGICCRQFHKPYAVLLAVVGYDVSQGGLEKDDKQSLKNSSDRLGSMHGYHKQHRNYLTKYTEHGGMLKQRDYRVVKNNKIITIKMER